jgi:phosphoglycerol transferase MdoB-like AlkP superfamily enzyme
VRLSRSAKFRRYYGLGICATPLIASCFYTAGYRIQGIFCPLRHWFGAIVRGNWRQAIEYHLFGPLLFGCLGLILVHWVWELKSGNRHHTFYLNWLTNSRLQLAIAIAFFSYYLLRLNSIIVTTAL